MPSVTRKPRPDRAELKQQRRAEIRGRLLAALEALLDDGSSYTELSVERLIREAGVARSTFYAYFDDKGDLLLALANDVVDELLESALGWLELDASASRQDVEAALRRFADVYVQHRVVVAAIAETAALDPRVGDLLDDRLGQLTGHIATHLAIGRKSGLVRADVDPETTAPWISGLLERGLHRLTGPGLPPATERVVAGLTTVLSNGIYRTA